MSGVRLEGITKVFGSTVVLTKTDLDIKDGEFLVLVGPSGCGKSTTLRIVAGLETPTEGSVFIGNRNVTKLEPSDRDIAMVFQDYALYPHMKVFDNMAFGLKLRKVSKKEITERVNEAAEMLGLTNLLDRYPKQLSGGQRQRVALGRAVVRHPQVFLMDEPLSNLDAKLRVQTRAELIKLHQKLKSTVIYVTHDQTEAMTMGTRIVVMKDGLVQQVDTPKFIYDHPANMFVAGFIGSPPMNFIKGSLETANGKVLFKSQGISLELPTTSAEAPKQQDVVLGIRPENVEVIDQNKFEESKFLTCHVEVSEYVGSESIVHTKTPDGQKLVVKVNANGKIAEPGETIKLRPLDGFLHLFDPQSGSNLLSMKV
ncbi:MAG: ABC transporter ATP-binding protein [Desulfitobacterium hafniense]|nr:ABC transporter ATP-binding protein [Desulfitobacterium hafniense]